MLKNYNKKTAIMTVTFYGAPSENRTCTSSLPWTWSTFNLWGHKYQKDYIKKETKNKALKRKS